MARPLNTDFIHSMRFWVTVVGAESALSGRLQPSVFLPGAHAGFSACTTPEGAVDSVEYREGHYVYTRKLPGIPTMSDITLSRGVAKTDSAFYEWMRVTMEGSGVNNYREDIVIHHHHRESLLGNSGSTSASAFDVVDTPGSRKYNLFEAYPIRHKVASDLDATASEISIMELDVAFEHFTITIES
jgi:phage tail-like protein